MYNQTNLILKPSYRKRQSFYYPKARFQSTVQKNYLNNININDENGVLDFLENANDTFEGIELVLSCFDYKEKEGKKLEELIEKIKKCCEEKLKINVTVCEESQISHNVLKYMNLFYKN